MSKIIKLTMGQSTIVDDSDYETLKNFNWTARYGGHGPAYAGRKESKPPYKIVMMHNQIMNPPKGFLIDHINLHTLDNRRSNLRICTVHQNHMNRKPIKNRKYKGIGRYSYGDKIYGWRARIMFMRRETHIGCFKTRKSAALAYNKKAIELYGEFARLNPV